MSCHMMYISAERLLKAVKTVCKEIYSGNMSSFSVFRDWGPVCAPDPKRVVNQFGMDNIRQLLYKPCYEKKWAGKASSYE